MLNENDIVSILTKYLEGKGYEILQSLETGDRGIDIIAQNKSHILYIEAKGETSSKEHTSRYGKAFNGNQIKSHVSRALLASMALLQSKPSGAKTKIAIALPDTDGHRDLMDKIIGPVKSLGIKIFWVSRQKVLEQ